MNSSLFFWHYRVLAFHVTNFASPSAWHSFPLFPRVLAPDDLAGMQAVSSLISPRTT